MTSATRHWFVQTDFGAVLGPMPNDALAEMARTGALLERDRVREGNEGEWRLASEVPGLFDEQTPALGLLSSTLEDLFATENSAPNDSAASRTARRRTPKSTDETQGTRESQELEFELDTPIVAPPATTEMPAEVFEHQFEVDVPLIAPASHPEIRSKPELVQELATRVEPPNVVDPKVVEPEVVLPAPSSWQASANRQQWQPTSRRSRDLKFDQQFWLRASISSVVFLVLATAWWFWPRQRADIYASYRKIYQELQQRRESTEDYDGWTEFVFRAKKDLETTVAWLERNAKPGDREKSLLLYAGRDLQELLELRRAATSPHQKRLDAFFEQLQEIYGSK